MDDIIENKEAKNKDLNISNRNNLEKNNEKLITVEDSIVANANILPTIDNIISKGKENDESKKENIIKENRNKKKNKRKNKGKNKMENEKINEIKDDEEKEIKEEKNEDMNEAEETVARINDENIKVEETKEVKEEKIGLEKEEGIDKEIKGKNEKDGKNGKGGITEIKELNENNDIKENIEIKNNENEKKEIKEDKTKKELTNNKDNEQDNMNKNNINININDDNDSINDDSINEEKSLTKDTNKFTENEPLNESNQKINYKITEVNSTSPSNQEKFSSDSYQLPYSFNISSINEPIQYTILRELFLIFKKLKFVIKVPFIKKGPMKKGIIYNNINNNNYIDYHIRQWDLWIPFLFDFFLAFFLTFYYEENRSIHAIWFFIFFWLGNGLIYLNSYLLEINFSFFQICSIAGYCLLPMDFCGLVFCLFKFWKPIKFMLSIGSLAWSVLSSNGYLEFLLMEEQIRIKYLVMYPIMIMYLYFWWYLFISGK